MFCFKKKSGFYGIYEINQHEDHNSFGCYFQLAASIFSVGCWNASMFQENVSCLFEKGGRYIDLMPIVLTSKLLMIRLKTIRETKKSFERFKASKNGKLMIDNSTLE